MSKYTTEVRFLCESLAGLTESTEYAEVDEVIDKARVKIFSFNYPIFDEAYRGVLEKKILKHFYTREIGLETYGLWKLKLDTKLNEIMPYYNKLYESALIEFNPIYTHDLYRKKDVSVDVADSTEQVASGTDSGSATKRDLYSDTPQGALTGVENETYLTDARKTTNEYETENSNSITQSKNGNTLEDYLEHVYGYEGKDASELILKYRQTFLNVDLLVLNELEELFMQVW